MEITVDEFIDYLKQNKSVCLKFKPSCPNNNPSVLCYKLTDEGMILEYYWYNNTVYPVCNINNRRRIDDEFTLSLKEVIEMYKYEE